MMNDDTPQLMRSTASSNSSSSHHQQAHHVAAGEHRSLLQPSALSRSTPTAPTPPRQPITIPIFPTRVLAILLTETAERFAYYGFRAILTLYLTERLQFTSSQAISVYAYTTSFAYFTPLLGAAMADAYWGRYRTIVVFGSIYAVGISVLTLAAFYGDDADAGSKGVVSLLSFTGLFLICIGTGGIKPCVSAFGADQISSSSAALSTCSDDDGAASSEEEIQNFFAWFYFGINVGSLLSFIIIPIVKAEYGFGVAFLLPAVFIVFAMLGFVSKRDQYVIFSPGSEKGQTQTNSRGFVNILRILMETANRSLIHSQNSAKDGDDEEPPTTGLSNLQFGGTSLMSQSIPSNNNKFTKEEFRDAQSALVVMPVLLAISPFWMLYDQQGSVWLLQASKMNLHGLQPEQVQVLNPLFIMILVPLFDQKIYPWLRQRGISNAHLDRMSCGMCISALAFYMSAFLEGVVEKSYAQALSHGEGNASISVAWQIPQMFIISVAEILVSVTGLEFAYASSPTSMKSLIMAAFLMTTSIGDFFAGVLYSSLSNVNRATILYLCATLMLVHLGLFIKIAQWWKRRTCASME